MNNGHTNAIFSKTEAENPTQPENLIPSDNLTQPDTPVQSDNLDEKDWQRSLEISAPANMPTPEDLQAKSNDFFNSENTVGNFPTAEEEAAEKQANSDNEPPLDQTTPDPHELGQIIPITTHTPAATTDSQPSYNPINIKTTGDRLEKSTIPEIDNAISELNQTGDLNNFYNEIRGEGGMTDANLSNSFNRKLGSDQPARGKG